MRRTTGVPLAAAALVVVGGLAACARAEDNEPAGQIIANNHGCAACHGANGEGATAPSWKGLYGSRITLEDGSTVTVDRQYLVTAIKDPAAQLVKGQTLKMPQNQLTDAEVQAVVDYVVSLKG